MLFVFSKCPCGLILRAILLGHRVVAVSSRRWSDVENHQMGTRLQQEGTTQQSFSAYIVPWRLDCNLQ